MPRHDDEYARNAMRDETAECERSKRESHDLRACNCDGCALRLWFGELPPASTKESR